MFNSTPRIVRLAPAVRNDAARTARSTGVPVKFERAAVVPSTSSRMRLANGIEVDRVRFRSFSDEIAQFAHTIATRPHEVARQTEGLAQRLMSLHVAELKSHGEELARHYDKPHAERWAEHRERLRKALDDDPEIGRNRRDTSVARSGAVVNRYGEAHGEKRKQALLDAAGQTGMGDHPALHHFLNWVHGELAKSGAPRLAKGKGARLYGGSNGSRRAEREQPKPAAQQAARPMGRKAVSGRSAASKLYGKK